MNDGELLARAERLAQLPPPAPPAVRVLETRVIEFEGGRQQLMKLDRLGWCPGLIELDDEPTTGGSP